MTAFADIRGAIVTAWDGVSIDRATSYEGESDQGEAFAPPNNAPWFALWILPVGTQPAALGNNAPLEHVNLLQIDINHPLGTHTGQLLADADTIAAVFNPGATFTYNGFRLSVERCERSSIRRSDAWLTLSMTVRLRGWQHRT